MAQQAASTELTGGAGFTYEDTVVAYYLAALLREEGAAPLTGIVKSVAVQQAGHEDPMDDIVIELNDSGSIRKLSLQGKRAVTVSAAATNIDFRDIMKRALTRRASHDFQDGLDAYGFVVEHGAVDPFRSLHRLIEWAKSSPTGAHFCARFSPAGAAAAAEREMREELAPLINAQSEDDERSFYAHFVALRLDGLTEGGVLRTEVINRLQEMIAANEDGQNLLLFDRLCRIAREGASTGCKWTRQTLLRQLHGALRLNITPKYKHDIEILNAFSGAGLADISEEIENFRLNRPNIEQRIRERLQENRLVNISGLPGCGKSAMLKRIATIDASKGPILFLKSDRLEGNSWLSFATHLGLQHHAIVEILAEIGSTGTPVLFVDGIDRIRPDQRSIITDILRAIEENGQFSHWRVLASSRDQGLEAYRAWFPASFYRQYAIGDVTVTAFSDEEANTLVEKMPKLRRLLFGAPAVREIARRPFFAAVLARSFPDSATTPQTEVDLITAWWNLAGHNTPEEIVPQRQRALIDLAEKGVRNLGKHIQTRELKDATIEQIAGLKVDSIIRDQNGGASRSFTHDIFFEWVFFRYLIDLGDNWSDGLIQAGEPPLLGRVVGLLAQNALTIPGKWPSGYRILEGQTLRPQWRREWLTAAPFTPAFEQGNQEFQSLLGENDFALLEKLLVWFQAQHTIPSPIVLQNPEVAVSGLDRVGIAELLSWPSDFEGWMRLLDWLIPLSSNLPPKLLPHVLEIFTVWQNAFTDTKNIRSEVIIDACNSWLLELEGIEYSETFSVERGRWSTLGEEAISSLLTALRMLIVRSARSYPAPAVALFDRAAKAQRMRREIYAELMGYTPIMAEVSPDSVVAVAKAALIEELPQERADREGREYQQQIAWIKWLRAVPETERTEEQKSALEHSFFPDSRKRDNYDELGINRHHNYYYPPSALHEPFGTLFEKKPEVALGLVRTLANHATTGWRQVQFMNRRSMGTPIPVTVEFPWGKQVFWGDWRVYNWFLTSLAPQPLECAFEALKYWAFTQIDRGTSTDEIIRKTVEDNECLAVLGLALVLALETFRASETTLPIVTCQRLWEYDIARMVQEPNRDIDLLGFGFLSRLTGMKAKAKDFLDSRASRKRDIKEFATYFALNESAGLRERFREALGRFPFDLTYEREEQCSNPTVQKFLKEHAEQWAGLGDAKNYRKHETARDQLLISYVSPKPLTPEQEKRLVQNTNYLQEHSVISWAMKSLQDHKIAHGIKLEDAILFARARDTATIFTQRFDVGEHSPQTAVSAIAAVVIRSGVTSGSDYEWAWDVMNRVYHMKELQGTFPGSRIPWHPAKHLVKALFYDRRNVIPRTDSVRWLIELTSHPLEEVSALAFNALLCDSDDHVQWVTAQLAMDLSINHHSQWTGSEHDDTADINARKSSLRAALGRLNEKKASQFTDVPPPWVKSQGRPKSRVSREDEWADADPSFEPQCAAKLFSQFPIERWCRSVTYKPMLERLLRQLVAWTAERLMPSWWDDKKHRERDYSTIDLIQWNSSLGDLLARAAPFFGLETVRNLFLAPFLTNAEEGLAVLARFADMTVTRHILDAATVPTNTFALLSDCVDRLTRDRAFNPVNYRAGEVHGHDLPDLIQALLFVKIETDAPGAARFANGDWSQIAIIIPLITPLVTKIGWSVFVMHNFLTLCERAGIYYPIDGFTQQVNAVLRSIAAARGSWTGTSLAARTAATVQRLADSNFPLAVGQARGLLEILDALIDLGDRRSAALEQSEAFKAIQGAASLPQK